MGNNQKTKKLTHFTPHHPKFIILGISSHLLLPLHSDPPAVPGAPSWAEEVSTGHDLLQSSTSDIPLYSGYG